MTRSFSSVTVAFDRYGSFIHFIHDLGAAAYDNDEGGGFSHLRIQLASGRSTTHVATTVTKETTPEQLAEIVKETLDMLSSSGLAYDKDEVYKQFEEMAADKHGLPVDAWRKLWVAPEPEPEPAPAAAEPVARKARKAAPTEIDHNYFYVPDKEQAFLELWYSVAQNPDISAHLLDTGPSGQGKSEKYKNFAKQKDIPFFKLDCPAIVTTEDWVGHMRVNETGTYFEKSALVNFLEQPGPRFLLLDELNRQPSTLLGPTISLLDRFKSIHLPEIGATVEVAPGLVVAATSNLGAAYHGTYPLDFALASRFGYRTETTYPPIDEEIKILVNRTGVDEDRAKLLVEVATQIRAKVPDPLEFPVSTRNLLDCAVLVAAGMAITDAADYTFVKFYSEEGGSSSQRTVVRTILSGKASGK